MIVATIIAIATLSDRMDAKTDTEQVLARWEADEAAVEFWHDLETG